MSAVGIIALAYVSLEAGNWAVAFVGRSWSLRKGGRKSLFGAG
jgi:hypothetical protein